MGGLSTKPSIFVDAPRVYVTVCGERDEVIRACCDGYEFMGNVENGHREVLEG